MVRPDSKRSRSTAWLTAVYMAIAIAHGFGSGPHTELKRQSEIDQLTLNPLVNDRNGWPGGCWDRVYMCIFGIDAVR